jgi:2-succinyl-5-enolpyruvyl-6-hydroxy-3-cyclohexene-1-carboxylate synthase
MILVADTQHNRDALHGKTRIVPLGVEGLMAQRKEGASADAPELREYAGAWAAADEAAGSHLANAFEKTSAMFEAKASWLLARHLSKETPVFVAGSMPVRDAEYFWSASNRRHRFYFNRGANGIDGTLSTALGVAHGGRPIVVLTGDLALLHDTNGFLTASKLSGSLTIVLINNNGGGIFEHLAIANFNPPFEDLFATPQNMDFAKLCAAYGVEHLAVADWTQFEKLVSALPETGVRVLEIKTDRKGDAATRKKLLNETGRAAGK